MKIKIAKNNKIGIVTVNRPESLNAMNKDVVIEFISKIEGLLSERDIRVIIIKTGDDSLCKKTARAPLFAYYTVP